MNGPLVNGRLQWGVALDIRKLRGYVPPTFLRQERALPTQARRPRTQYAGVGASCEGNHTGEDNMMGKMPLAGLIGAWGLGMLLTGCNCCNRNGARPSYAGGRAETSMGLFSGQHPRNQSTTIPTPLEDATGKSLVSPASTGSDAGFIPRGSSSASAAGMTTPSSSGNMTPMSSSSSAPANNSSPTPLSANTTNPSALSSSLSNSNSAWSTPPPGAGSNSLPSSPIQQVSHRTSDSPHSSNGKAPASSSTDSDGTPYLPSKGPSRIIPAPPSPTDSYTPTPGSKASSTPTKNSTSSTKKQPSSSLSSPSPSPPTDNTSLLSDPPPNVNLKSTSNLSSSSASSSTSSSSPLIGPGYLK